MSDDNFTQAKRVVSEGSIKMIAIDDLACEQVDLIKIDVEGYEMEVLKGAERTLTDTQYLMIELNNNTKKYGSSNTDVESYLRDIGFRVLIEHWPDKVFYRT